MQLFLDEDVPASVAEVFRTHGHGVRFTRDIVAPGSPDQLVATVSEIQEAVLVSCDSDFQRIAPRIPKGSRRRFSRLSRISLGCRQPRAAKRVEAAMSLIEHEYEFAQSSNDKRMILVIKDSVIRTHR
ncbi:MAG: DUF5615 family PIN-like protein [Sphingomonadales bacterium]|nr:DUF5615 family PIN-like protein [Sphingomonadales bacterium]